MPGETGLQIYEAETYEQTKAPFKEAFSEWLNTQSPSVKGQLILSPNKCGLQIGINRRLVEPFVDEQFFSFRKSQSTGQNFFGQWDNVGNWRFFFSETAFTALDTALVDGIEKGILPHPSGKLVGTERAGMPGSLEDDCARENGSNWYDLETTLAEHLKHYSSKNAEQDKAFMEDFCTYLGLNEEQAEGLMSRVLDHHGLPNIHKARRSYGARLKTALQQCYGIRQEYQKTTPTAVVADQAKQWQGEYLKPPLLDGILESSLYFYDPKKIAAYYVDLGSRHPRDVDPDLKYRLEEGRAIMDALQAFRASIVGCLELEVQGPKVLDVTAVEVKK